MIIEAKKGPGVASARHVLCAESDRERDHWVELLVRYVSGGYNDADEVTPVSVPADDKGRASVSSSSDAAGPPTRRPYKEDIAISGAVPISQSALLCFTRSRLPRGCVATAPNGGATQLPPHKLRTVRERS